MFSDSTTLVNTLTPLTSLILFTKLFNSALAIFCCKLSFSLASFLISDCNPETFSTTLEALAFVNFSTERSVSSCSLKYSYAALPVKASILRTPAATPDSETILKIPTSALLALWVPPHNSIE